MLLLLTLGLHSHWGWGRLSAALDSSRKGFVLANILFPTLSGPLIVPEDVSGLGQHQGLPTQALPFCPLHPISLDVPYRSAHGPDAAPSLPQSSGSLACLWLLQVPFPWPELFLVPSAPPLTGLGPPPHSGCQLSPLLLLQALRIRQPPPHSLP